MLDVKIPEMWITDLPKRHNVTIKIVGRRPSGKLGCVAELIRLSPINEQEVLTGRQEEIIMMAFERVYFETPRKTKLKDLAKITGVSQATLSELLRKGQKRIVVEFLRSK